MTRRKLLPIVAVLCVSVTTFLWAHGQSESAGTSTAQPQIDLGITWWGNQTSDQRYIEVIKMYEKIHPNIHIIYQFSGWSNYWTKVTTEAAGKNLPDIMQQSTTYLRRWHSDNLLTNLDPYAKSGLLDISDVKPLYLSESKLDGHLYALPLGVNSTVFILNTGDFKKAGLPLPPKLWTWTEFEHDALALHKRLGIWGMGPDLTNSDLWEGLWLGLGELPFAPTGKALGHTNNAAFVSFLKMALKLQATGAMPQESQVLIYANKGPEQNPIVNGKAAMATMWSSQIVPIQRAAGPKKHFALYLLPRPAGGKSEDYAHDSLSFAITTQAKHPKAAAAFMSWFINSIPANKVLFAVRGFPIVGKVQTALKPMLTPTLKMEFKYMTFLSDGHAASTPPLDPNQAPNVYNNVYNPLVIQPVMFGKISPEKGAAIMMKDANAILSGKQS